MAIWLILLAFGLGGLGAWLLLRARALRQDAGLPAGRVAYVDTGAWNRCERPLFSHRFHLTGRPDYLVQTKEGLIPVEVKSGQAPAQPYSAHVLQLAAYCLLVEEQEGRSPPHGIIKYGNKAFEVEYTSGLRAELLRTLDAVRRDLRATNVARDHDEVGRCQGCGYGEQCDQHLA